MLSMEYPSPRRSWWMVALLCLAGQVSYTDRYILGVLVDPIRHDLSIGDSGIGLLQGAAFAVIYVLAGLPLGRLADRGKRLRIIIAGAVLWCSGIILCGLAPSFNALFAGRLLVGIGEAALAPAAVSMIADAFPPQRRGLALGIFLTGTVLGSPTAISLGGAMLGALQAGRFEAFPPLAHLAPWRAVLLMIGAAGFLVPLLLLTVREPKRRTNETRTASVREVADGLLKDKGVLVPLYLGMALLSVGDYGLFSWVPTLLSRKFLMAPQELGTVFGVITSVAGVIGGLAGGFLSDVVARRYGSRARVLLPASASLLAIAAGVSMAGNQTLVLAGLGLWTLASAIGGISGFAALQELVAGESRGVAIAIVAFCNTLLGLGAGPSLVALATERYFGDDLAVGRAIALVVAPAAAIACALFVTARIAEATPRKAIDAPTQ